MGQVIDFQNKRLERILDNQKTPLDEVIELSQIQQQVFLTCAYQYKMIAIEYSHQMIKDYFRMFGL